jgi:hypothetical protein
MEKNLLSVFFALSLFFLNPLSGFGQCSANVSISSSDADNVICAGDLVTFTATPTDGGSNPLYQWRVNALNVGTNSSDNTFTTSTLQNGYVVSVVLTSDFPSCVSGNPYLSNSIATTVNPIPTLTITNPSPVCSPSTVNLTANAVTAGSTAGLTYTYWTNAGATSSFSTPTAAGAGTYYIKGTTTAGCFNIKPVTVTVNLPPTLTITNPSPVCSPSTVNLTANAVTAGSTAGLTYTYWTNAGATSSYGTPTAADAGTYYVKGTTTAGCFDIKPVTVTVNLPPTLTITNPSPVCSPSTVNLTATAVTVGSTAGLTYSYWTNAGATSSYGTPTAASAGTYYIKGTTAEGCFDIKPVTITVNPIPTLTITNPSPVCSPSSVNLTVASVTAGSTPGLTYTYWTDAGATSSYGTPSAASAGTYYIKGTTTEGCFDIKPVTVTVNLPPTLTITNPSPVCSPSTVNLTSAAVTAGSTAGLTFTYWTNAGTTSSYGTPTAAGAGTYYIKGTTAAGCFDIKPVTVTVNPSPTLTITNPSAVCSPSTVNLTAAAVTAGSTAGLTFTYWTNAGTTSSYGTPTAAGAGTYYIKGTTAAGCFEIKPVTVTITPTVTPSVTITSTSNAICSSPGTPVTFTATPDNGGASPSYQWRRNGTNISGATNSTYTTTSLASPPTITVTMTSNAICASPSTVTSNVISMNVFTGNPSTGNGNSPGARITSNSSGSICPGPNTTTLTFSAPTDSQNVENFVWNLPPGFIITNGEGTSEITVSVLGPGALIANGQKVSVTAVNPCNSVTSKEYDVNVNKFAAVDAGPDDSMCLNSNIILTNTLSGNANTVTWNVVNGTGTITGGPYPSPFFFQSNIEGTVTLRATTNTAAGSCSSGAATGKDDVIITVRKPSIAPTSLGTPTTVCNGISTILTQTGGSLGTGASWKWYSNPGFTTLVGTSAAANASLTVTPTATTTYYLRAESTTGAPCTANIAAPGSVTITVNQPVVITTQPTASQTLCSGSAANFSVTATGTGLSYQWKKDGSTISGATVATYSIPTVTTSNAGVYTVVVSGTAPCTAVTSSNATLNVNQIIAITAQPTDTQTLCSGSAANFSVTATGTGLSYQWKKGGTNIPGATSNTYSIPIVSPADAGTYTVVVSGASPCTSVTTQNAVLNVNQAVAITAEPISTQTLCSGSIANFSVTATGTGLSYQWKKGGTDIPGATLNTYSISNIGTSDAATYTVVVSGSSPCTPVTSKDAVLNVNQVVAITAQPTATQTLCSGSTANFSVTATGTGLTYQWKKGGTNIVNATSATLTLSNVSTSDSGNYTVEVSGISPCGPVTSSTAALTINQEVVISTQPISSQTVCSGFSVSFSVTATGTGLTYQWRKGNTPLSNGGNISGVNSATLTISNTLTTDAATNYNVVVSGTSACTPDTSQDAVLNVNQDINISGQPVETEICEGDNTFISVTATGTGLSYQWRKGGIPISGATESIYSFTSSINDAGSYDVVISSQGGTCSQTISNPATLKVNPISTMSLTSAAGSDNQIKCISTAITPIIYTVGGSTGASISAGALPTGVTGVYNAGKFTISGTPTVAGTFNYTVTTTGGCTSVSLNGTIKVDPNNTVSLTSAAGTNSQTLCVNTPIANIKYATTGATGASFSGLPTGVTGSWAANIVTISGSPSVTGGPFNYTITLTGGCSVVTATGTINVNPNNTISLTSAAATNSQTLCVNTSLTDIKYATTGATGASFSGLPTGVTGSWASNIVTISGTPTIASGASNYTITLTGGCSVVTAPGTINVTPNNTVNLTSAAGTNTQTLCVNTPLTDIKYATTGATGASFSGLPTGVTGSWAGNIITISGTPTVTGGPFNYTITLTGGCSVVTATGTINITPNNTINLTSTAGTNTQTLCVNTPLINIKYATTGATGATFSGLPTGVSGSWAANIVTISGTPTATGAPFNYTITLTGGCSVVTAPGTINVTPNNTVNLTSAAGTNTQTLCVNTSLINIKYATTGATGASFSGLPAGVTGSWAGNIVTISGTPTVAGITSNYTITLTGGCSVVTATGTIKVDPVPVGGNLLFTQNNERIYLTCVSPTSSNSLSNITLSGHSGTGIVWKYRKASTLPLGSWITITPGIATTLTAAEIFALGVNESMVFLVEISNGVCTQKALSQTAILSIIPSNIKPSPVKVDPAVVCKGEKVTLSSSTGYGENYGKFEGGAFDNAGIKNKGWKFSSGDFDGGLNNGRMSEWGLMNPHGGNGKVYTANIQNPIPSLGTMVDWDSSSGNSGNKGFAMVTGNRTSTMETPVFALTGLDEAILTFDQAYNLTAGAKISVEISTNGGSTYTNVLFSITGDGTINTGSSGNYTSFGDGNPTSRPKNKMVIDLGNYLGQPNLRIRFNFQGKIDGDVWAVDNIKVPEGPQDIILEWRDYSNPVNFPNGEFIGINNSEQWEPKLIGWNKFEVRTSIILDSNGQNCSTVENSETIRVFVFDRYTTTITAIAGTCGNYTVNLTANVVGAFGGNVVSYPTTDGYTGEWVITQAGAIANPTTYTLTNSDSNSALSPKNNPNARFEAINSGDFTFTWKLNSTAVYPVDYFDVDQRGKVVQNNGCTPVLTPTPIQLQDCTALNFDGIDDYVDLGPGYTGNYSIEAWIRPKKSTGTIISGPNFEIKMTDLPATIIPNTRWYHVAVSNGKLYIDGIQIGNAGSGIGGSRTLIGSRWNSTSGKPENYFSGWIEEVRIWKKNITQDQIRFMMNQHLQNTANIGVEIPMPAPGGGLVYGDLAGYYRLISKIPDPANLVTFAATLLPANGFTPDLANTAVPGKLNNMTTNQENTAPMPYISGSNGDWETGGNTTWLRPSVWDDPNSNGINSTPIEWNIVRTRHNIESKVKDITVLGLISETGKLNMMNPGSTPNEYNSGQFLRVTHYLKLDGVIDLEGESQLLQDPGSILDEASAGYLERDQQGKRNSFVYNYWSSPVSKQGEPNNALYNVSSVLRDGTTASSPKTITFNSAYWAADGTAISDPIIISTYWLWGYSPATANIYAEWDHILETGNLETGEGFTMKGTNGGAGINEEQNYTFRGKPHNGDFDLSMAPEQNYLIGNPYASAMDADEFILDNLVNVVGGRNIQDNKNVFDGALYFWDHFQVVDHILKEYIGGYATYNLTGGVKAISDDVRINANDAKGSKYPGQYIPVAQGFLINSSGVDGGEVHFKNSQRAFVREINPLDSQFLKPESVTKKGKTSTEMPTKIRLSIKSPVGYHRQILVGAIPYTTNGFDLGYDALLFDNNVEDMYWIQGDNQLVIQGVPNFDKDQVLPLGVKIKENKEFMIKIDTLENAPTKMNVYLNDKLKDSIHDLKAGPYVSTSEPGYIHDRFEIIFFKEEPPFVEGPIVGEPGEEEPIIEVPETDFTTLSIKHAYNLREIQILNPDKLIITSVFLFDLNGNLIENYTNIPQHKEIKLKVGNYSSGVYLLKVYAEGKIIRKKIIINNKQ